MTDHRDKLRESGKIRKRRDEIGRLDEEKVGETSGRQNWTEETGEV